MPVSKVGRGRSPRRRVRDDDWSTDGRRMVVESSLAEAIQGFSAEIWNSGFRGRRSIFGEVRG